MDPYYFQEAPKKLHKAVTGVLTLASEEKLLLYAAPDPKAKPVLECERPSIETLPAGEGRPQRREACGLRLLGWSRDKSRFQLPVARTARAGDDRWYEAVRDPEADERGWLRLEEGMEHRRLDAWVRSGPALRRSSLAPYGTVLIRTAPLDGAPLVPIPRAPEEAELRHRGLEGSWLRVELAGPGCRTEGGEGRPRPGYIPACPSGWTRWRGTDGELLLLPDDR